MAAPHDEREPVAGERLADGAGRQRRRGGRKTEVDMTLLHSRHDVATDRLEPEIDAWSFGLQAGDQPRREQNGLGVGGGDADRTAESRGIEILGAKKTAQLLERRRRLWRELFRERRRREAAAEADEQRIAEDFA